MHLDIPYQYLHRRRIGMLQKPSDSIGVNDAFSPDRIKRACIRRIRLSRRRKNMQTGLGVNPGFAVPFGLLLLK